MIKKRTFKGMDFDELCRRHTLLVKRILQRDLEIQKLKQELETLQPSSNAPEDPWKSSTLFRGDY